MILEGSCHCGAVRFKLQSHTPTPYMHCYCSICRKTAGAGGSAVNIMGEAATLEVKGRANVSTYRVNLGRGGRRKLSPARRHFCKRCGSALWVADPRWAQWVYPFASAIDTPLPVPRERAHILLEFKPAWVRVPRTVRGSVKERRFDGYPDEAIIDWHTRRGLLR